MLKAKNRQLTAKKNYKLLNYYKLLTLNYKL